MRWTGHFVFCTLFLYPISVWPTNPGLKGKITTKGIDYGCKIVMSVLRNRLLDVKIPDVSGNKHIDVLHQLQYNISRITISNVNFPDTSVTLVSNMGLKVAVSIGYIEMSGNWHIKSKILRTHGRLKAQINNIATSFYLKFGKDSTGRPTMVIMDCTSYIAKLQIHVFGKSSWFYNLIMRWFEPSIRKYLSGKICLELKKILKEKIHPFLQTVPVTKKIGRYIGIDYSLTSTPLVTTDSLILPLKGEFYNLLHRNDVPFPAPALNFTSGHERMLYIGFSEYFFNSAGYVFNSLGGISINITDDMATTAKAIRTKLLKLCSLAQKAFCYTQEMYVKPAHNSLLPDNSHIRFDTQTIGTLIPQMKKMYPVMKMKLHLITDSAPSVAFESGKIILTASGDTYVFAILPNSTLVPLFNVKLVTNPGALKCVTKIMAAPDANKLVNAGLRARVELSLKKSNIGPFQVNCLQAGIDFLISIVILPRINAILADGYPLPLIDHIKLYNIVVQPHKNFLLFATDITYY